MMKIMTLFINSLKDFIMQLNNTIIISLYGNIRVPNGILQEGHFVTNPPFYRHLMTKETSVVHIIKLLPPSILSKLKNTAQ